MNNAEAFWVLRQIISHYVLTTQEQEALRRAQEALQFEDMYHEVMKKNSIPERFE